MDKKTELEMKKAKLEQIRQRKAATSSAANMPGQTSSTAAAETLNVDPDKILIECGITTPVLFSNNSQTASASSFNDDSSTPTLSTINSSNSIHGNLKSIVKNKKPFKLTVNQVNAIDIPPKENVTYTKETQTPQTDLPIDKDAKPVDYYVLTYDNIDEEDATSLDAMSVSTTTQTNLTNHRPGSQKNHSSSQRNKSQSDGGGAKLDEQLNDDLKNIDEKLKNMNLKEMDDDERQRLIDSEEFLSFFMRSSKLLEKALDQDDIFFEYGATDNNEIVQAGQAFKLNKEFHDDKYKNRTVTSLDWSPHFPELLLAAYEDSSLDPDGVALVWNTKFKLTSPEFILNCSSWVTSCCFAKFHPNLIIGGTYSGQIVMWDNRVNKRTPIQRSTLSAASHTHPIYCVQVVGSQNAHNLISISNDGKLCSWTLDNMNSPQESLELGKQAKQVAVTTMGFRSGDVNNFLVGCEEGPIYSATRHGNKSGINETFEGHYGPVTGLSCHQVQGPIDFSHIFLTSSFDWTVKLWNLKEPSKPLYSFEHNSDYVYDVQWSPINPNLFACVDGTGRLDLWNLINDAEVPTASLLIDSSPALNKMRWSPNGHQIAVGDDQGKISLIDVNESYTNPRADDWSRMVKVLADLKRSTAEIEEATQTGAGGSSSGGASGPGAGGGGGGSGTPSSNAGSQTATPSSAASSLLPAGLTTTPTALPSVKSESSIDYRMVNSSAYLSSPPSNYIVNPLHVKSPTTPK